MNGLHRQLERDHPGADFPFLQVCYDPVTDEADLRYLSPRDGFGRFVVGLFAGRKVTFCILFATSRPFPLKEFHLYIYTYNVIYIYIHIFMDLDRRIRHLDLGQACASDMLAIQHSKGVCYLSLHSEQCAPCIRRSQGNRELPVWR